MKIPDKIKGRNKIRDAAIVLLFKRDDWSYPKLAERFNVTERRILQILALNHAFVKRDKEWEKEKRINLLKRRLTESTPTKKDELDILSELRKELDGDNSNTQSSPTVIILRFDDAGNQSSGPEVFGRTHTMAETNIERF